MSDYTDNDDVEVEPEARGLRKQLEQELQAKKVAESRALQAERELAFAKAGIDLNDQRMSYFVKGYDGEVDADKIKQAAMDAGFLQSAAPEVSADEMVQHEKAANLSAGSQTIDFDTDAEYVQALAQANSKDAVLALMDKFGSPRTSFI